ncbi:hypothetical protein [uncultured Cytophaga sp.]|uniref:hypothetical protein n=1 Tax=uncultured Cytophaga sp. TaxID=160238 RepID=UPI0026119EC8|nr:hypothetical protein [uncultured Cytophaga sp.]
MESTSPLMKIIEDFEDYVTTNATLYKLTTIKKAADIVSGLVSNLVLLMVVVFFLLMLSVGMSLWIGEILLSPYKGFLIVSGFYVFLFIVFFVFKTQLLKNPTRNIVVKEILKKDDDEE